LPQDFRQLTKTLRKTAGQVFTGNLYSLLQCRKKRPLSRGSMTFDH